MISFDNNNLIVKSDRIELSYLLDNVVKYYFIEKEETVVEEIKDGVNNIHLIYTNRDFLLIEGFRMKIR